jgi:hypothetical protein
MLFLAAETTIQSGILMSSVFGAMAAPIATYILSILVFFVIACYAIFRLKSTYILREKVWSSFVGERDFNDERLKSFSEEQLDLSRFRVMYGVSARSIVDLHRLLSWMVRHGLTPLDVKRARRWINPSRENPLEMPKLKYMLTWLFVLGMLLIGLFVALRANDSNETLLRMRASGIWYWSDGKTAYSLRSRWHIGNQSCTSGSLPDTSVTGFTSAETKLLCSGINDGQLDTIVKETVRVQRRMFASLAFVSSLLAIWAFLKVESAEYAGRLAKKLRSNSAVCLSDTVEPQDG